MDESGILADEKSTSIDEDGRCRGLYPCILPVKIVH